MSNSVTYAKLQCSECNKPVHAKIGFTSIDLQEIDPLGYYEDMIKKSGIHYDVKCDDCANKLDYNYEFQPMCCAVCGKSLGNLGFYKDRPIDIGVHEAFEDLMIQEGIHYEMRCDECMPVTAKSIKADNGTKTN
jgi:hypothetical protein